MEFSVIIVNYNTAQLTNDCLQSVFSHCQNNSFEIIVIDNDSRDDSVNILKKNFGDKIKLIENKSNLGFAKANNQGAKIAQGKYLFFLNSDTILKSNLLQTLGETLNENNKIGAIAPQLITKDGQNQVSAYGKYPTIKDLVIHKINKGTKESSVDWLSGAAIIIPKKVFNEIGAWDEKFFMYFEDIDLCHRIKDLDYSIIVQRTDTLTHLSGQSLNKNNKRREYYYQSQNYYFKKYHGLLSSLIMRLIRWPYKTLMMIKE